MKKLIIYFIIVIVVITGLILGINKLNYNKKTNINEKELETEIENEIDPEDIALEDWPDEFYEKYYNIKDITEEEKTRIIDWFYYGSHEIIGLICQKNGDWSRLPISKSLREKYNEKDGVLPDYQFDKVEVEKNEYPQSNNVRVIVTNGLAKTKLYLGYSSRKYGIDDIEVLDVIKLTDEKGNELNPGFPFDDKHIIINFLDWENVGLTNNFKRKYGDNLLNLFIHYSPLDYNPISFVESKSDLSKNMAYFTVYSALECKKREYEVYYTLDKDKYLDDAKAKLVKEINLDKTSENKYGSSNAFYKNSNIDIDFYSDNFKKKLQQKGSYFPDIDLVDINYAGEAKSIKKYECVYCLHMKTGQINSYYIKFIMDNDNRIDDTIVEKLPYTNMSAEEVKELYLKEYNK